MINRQDTTLDNQDNFIPNTSPYEESFKSPGKALLYSGILPGIGQVYMKKWQRGLLFVALDGIAIGTWYKNNNLAEEKKKEYANYANEHWDFGRWVHDYYKWEPETAPEDFSGDLESWNSIREVFVNKSDTLSGCDDHPYCYVEIWNHSHHVEFTWDGEIISSSQTLQNRDFFTDKYDELCGDYSYLNKTCDNDSSAIADKISEHSVVVIRDHHFYEGIQKYDMFFAGWADNDSVKVVIGADGSSNASSPNQSTYRKLWIDYKTIKKLAVYGGNFMLINRAVSMIDAVLLAKKWNNKHNVKLSLNAYPDLRNKSGLGGVKLSLHFN